MDGSNAIEFVASAFKLNVVQKLSKNARGDEIVTFFAVPHKCIYPMQ